MKTLFSGVSGLAIAIGLATVPVAGQCATAAVDAAPAADAAGGDTAGEIVVIGTRRADVTTLTSAVPVDVASSADLTAAGSTNLVTSLRTLLPAVSFAETGGQIGARQAKSVSLDGLGPSDTLVLVNGIRRNLSPRVSAGTEWGKGTQPVDLNDLPEGAVERVEVLRDGASAQYGSDAIAGVVNVVLRGNSPGGNITASYGQYDAGDGPRADINAWYTFKLGAKGFLNLDVEFQGANHSYRDYTDARQYYFALNNTTGLPCGPIASTGQPTAAQPLCHQDPREAQVNRRQSAYGDPITRKAISSFNGEYELTDRLTAYAFGTWAYRLGRTDGTTLPDSDGNLRALYPNGFQSSSFFTFRTQDGAAGLRFDGGAYGHFNLSTEYGQGFNTLSANTQNASLGLATPTHFYQGTYISKQSSTQLDYVNELKTPLSPAPLTLSAGLAYRWELYGIKAGDAASYANGGVAIADGPDAGKFPTPGAGGLSPLDAGTYKRTSESAYIGVDQKFFDQLLVSLAAREEHYSDFGDATVGKIASRWDITPWVALRGSVSNGFKAPTMGQLGWSSHTSAYIYPAVGPAYSGLILFGTPSNPVAQALGASPLKPEKSTNYSLGLVLRPTSSLSLTADVYRIDVKDNILPTDTLNGAYVTSVLTKYGYSAINSVRYFTNGLNSQTQGLDIVVRDHWDFGAYGQLQASVAANWNKVEITKLLPISPILNGSGVVPIGVQSQGFFTRFAPDNKWVATLAYTHGPWEVSATTTRYGHYVFTATTPALTQTFGVQWVENLAISRTFKDGYRFTVGANHILNSNPDQPLAGDVYSGANNCDLQAPEGCQGAYYYVRLDKKFF